MGETDWRYDAEFIAAARTLVPSLVAEVTELRAEVARLTAEGEWGTATGDRPDDVVVERRGEEIARASVAGWNSSRRVTTKAILYKRSVGPWEVVPHE